MLAKIWQMIPTKIRLGLIFGLLLVESRSGRPSETLKNLFQIRDKIDWAINDRSLTFGKGEHPKHRLTAYHDFFIERVKESNSVLDIGCGYGAVARSIAKAHPNCLVLGVDIDAERLKQAINSKGYPNLRYVLADATTDLPAEKWDVVVLSNVLEHIHDRVGFLRAIKEKVDPKKFLIRVPHFERDWQLAMRKELGIYYFSDPDHKIEHTIEEFESEILKAGLSIVDLNTPWGEIWAECV